MVSSKSSGFSVVSGVPAGPLRFTLYGEEVLMETREFFQRVRDSLEVTEGNDRVGADFFISDMEQLFEEWRDDNCEA